MPNWGKLYAVDSYQVRVASSVTSSSASATNATTSFFHKATLTTFYDIDVINKNVGVFLDVEANSGTNATNYIAQIPDLGLSWSASSTYQTSGEVIVEFVNLKLYVELVELYQLSWDSIKVYKNGVLQTTWAGGSMVSNNLAPGWIPLLGIAPTLYGSCGASGNPGSSPGSYSWSASITSKAEGGFQSITGGVPSTAMPVKIPPVSVASGLFTPVDTWASYLSPNSSSSNSGTITSDLIAISDGKVDHILRGTMGLWPNPRRSVQRFQPGYCAEWFRWGLPQCQSLGTHSDGIHYAGGTGSGTSTPYFNNPYPRMSQFEATVQDARHIIEDPLYADCLSPCYSFSQTVTTVGSVTSVHTVADEFTFPISVDSASTAQMNGALNHGDIESRMWQTWACPHWSYYLNFPPDGSSVWSFARQYWYDIRSQYTYFSALPSGEQRKTRTDLISSPLDNSGLTPWVDSFVANSMRFLGISRWDIDPCTFQSSYPLDSSTASSWTFTGCTATFAGDGIHLTQSGGATTYTATLDLGSFFIKPFMVGHLWTSVNLGFVSNIDAITAVVKGYDGTSQSVGTVPGTVPFPVGTASKYAGSWAQDNGDSVTSDTGTDLLGSGVSAALMGDPEGSFAFQMLPGRTAATLVVTITPHTPGTVAILKYPTLYPPSLHPYVMWESGQCAALLYKNGPGVRCGNWVWYIPGVGFQQPPALSGLGYKSTIIDAICFRRVVFQGVDPLTGGTSLDGTVTVPSLTTELAAKFDTLEGQSIAVVDKFSASFFLPKGSDETLRMAWVNAMREVPPLPTFARGARDPSTWLETATLALDVWDWAQETRYYATPAPNQLDIFDNSTPKVQWTAPSGIVWPGWNITSHTHKVDNTEGAGFNAYQGGTDLAHVSPWHGYLETGTPGGTEKHPWQWQDEDGSVMLVTIDADSDVYARWSPSYMPVGGIWQVANKATSGGGTRERPHVWKDRVTGWYYVAFGKLNGSVWDQYLTHSSDLGKTWSTPTLLMATARYAVGSSMPDGSQIIAWLVFDAGTTGPAKVQTQYRGPGDTSWSTPVDMVDGSATLIKTTDLGWGNPFGAFAPHAPWTIYMVANTETAVGQWMSTDLGKTWTRIL